MTAVVELPGPATGELTAFAARLDAVPGVDGAAVTGTSGNLARRTLGYAMDPQSAQARAMVDGSAPCPRRRAPPRSSPTTRPRWLDMLARGLPLLAGYVALVSSLVLLVVGVQHSARVVSRAAVLFCVAVGGFALGTSRSR